jgi:hypothetical protein
LTHRGYSTPLWVLNARSINTLVKVDLPVAVESDVRPAGAVVVEAVVRADVIVLPPGNGNFGTTQGENDTIEAARI